jgi:hypothetical protein
MKRKLYVNYIRRKNKKTCKIAEKMETLSFEDSKQTIEKAQADGKVLVLFLCRD